MPQEFTRLSSGAWVPTASQRNAPVEPPKVPRRPRRKIAVVVASSTALVVAGAFTGFAVGRSQQGTPDRAVTAPRARHVASLTTAQVARLVAPAVVNIQSAIDPLAGGGAAAGTGMIVSPGGLIVTNNHVVANADAVQVTIAGHGTHVAKVVGTDPAKDIALLRVTHVQHLPTVRFANSATAVVGDRVVALGNALGLGGAPTVSSGIVSALHRSITAATESGTSAEHLSGLLQTDAQIVPGNSGGPLTDSAGLVVGMDTATASNGTGGNLGFAIPSNEIVRVVDELRRHAALADLVYGRRGFIGVEVVNAAPYGAYVVGVEQNGPAANAGIVSGDAITKVNGVTIKSIAALTKAMGALHPGERVAIGLSAAGVDRVVHLKLATAPIA